MSGLPGILFQVNYGWCDVQFICFMVPHLRWSDIFCGVLNDVSQHGHTSYLSVHRALWTRLSLLICFLNDKYIPACIKDNINASIICRTQLNGNNGKKSVYMNYRVNIRRLNIFKDINGNAKTKTMNSQPNYSVKPL